MACLPNPPAVSWLACFYRNRVEQGVDVLGQCFSATRGCRRIEFDGEPQNKIYGRAAGWPRSATEGFAAEPFEQIAVNRGAEQLFGDDDAEAIRGDLRKSGLIALSPMRAEVATAPDAPLFENARELWGFE
jgi:hypothetical protein